MTWRRMPVLLLLAVCLMGQGTGGVGLIISTPGNTCASDPRTTGFVTGQSWCLDSVNQTLNVWTGGAWTNVSKASGSYVGGTSRLTFVGATQIQLGQGVVPIKIGSAWTLVPVTSPATLTNATLGASTTYFVYAYGAIPTLTTSTTGHTTDATFGIEVLSSDATRTLVGMVRTNGASQFEADNALQGVLSFYARRNIGLVNNFTANRTLAAATYAEINTEIRGNVLTWADEAVTVGASGTASNGNASNTVDTAIAFDSTTNQDGGAMSRIQNPTTGNRMPLTLMLVKNGLAEGFHFVTLVGAANGNTATWYGGTPSGSTETDVCTLTVGIRG